MDTNTVLLLVLALLLTLLAIRMPVALALALSGAVGLLLLQSGDYATNMLASVPFSESHAFSLTIIPMFILMGVFAVKARIAEQVYTAASHLFRRVPGGLGVATVMACAGFAAVSGSSIGTAATMSRLSITQMRKAGYPQSMAGAIVAIAGTLGVLIPPSVFLVLYAIMTGESVAAMLAAGIVPGVLSALAYATFILIRAPRVVATPAPVATATDLDAALAAASGGTGGTAPTPEGTDAAPEGTETAPPDGAPPTRLRDLEWRGVVRVGILFLIVLGGIYTGFFTPTESAAMGALVAAVMLVLEYRREGAATLYGQFTAALKETAGTTSMVFAIVVGSAVLSTFFVTARLPQTVTAWVSSFEVSPHLTMAILLLMLLPLGMALESISILVISVPLLYPVAMSLGFDGVWLGILIVKLIEIGMVTPPVGINCFVVSGTSGVKAERIFRGVAPFVCIELIVVILLFAFPEIVLWLPSLIG
ncbi:TRAP transporter large permease [Halostreptopolyspora alba]|uniref:TRAP transporter large permease subunit n=1 Tax=Halostreptopolyspora alba TaxID=2487137 RepID=A0A3N0EBS3_9ACTN|nr:TRAP transporter large permease subunit [Nocardiopsaceae bacterium YIM 96095]